MRKTIFIFILVGLLCPVLYSQPTWGSLGKIRWDMLDQDVIDSMRTSVSDSLAGEFIELESVRGIDLTSSAKDTIRAIVSDSLGFADDTTALKLLDLPEGRTAYLKQLSSANTYGGGWFAVIDSACPEAYKGDAYNHPTAGLQWVDAEFLKTGITNVLSFGADPDSTTGLTAAVANNYNINSAIDFAYATGTNKVYFPPGEYIFRANKSATAGGDDYHYGIQFEPGTELIGAGQLETVLYSDTTSGVSTFCSPNFETVDYEKRTAKISNMTFVGMAEYGDAYDATSGSGVYITRTGYRLKYAFVNNMAFRGFGGISLSVNNTDNVIVDQCYFEDNNFTALNFSGNLNTVFANSIVDSAYHGMEIGSEVEGVGGGSDSVSKFVCTNVTFSNIRDYGIKIYGGDYISINNIYISGMTGVNSTYAGIWFDPHLHTKGFKRIEVMNSSIVSVDSSKYNGISFRSGAVGGPAVTDSTFGNVNINNVNITGVKSNAIVLSPYDSSKIGTVRIANCTITDWNGVRTSGLGSTAINASNVNGLFISNNRIFNSRSAATIYERSPGYLANCDNSSFVNNNCVDYTGATSQTLFWNTSEPVVSNNDGLNVDAAHCQYTSPATFTYYFAHFAPSINGAFIAGSQSGIGILYTTILDTACTVYYNTSGAAVDTIRVHPTR